MAGTEAGNIVTEAQFQKIRSADGFIAALDQSGGSSARALQLYGIGPDAYSSDEAMFDLMHEMRCRIMSSPSFDGQRILGAILFEDTMDRDIAGQESAHYLWNVKNVVPFLKVDKGLADPANGVQVMKPMPGLGAVLVRAREKGIFGTKMRSVIKLADRTGVQAVVDQQFDVAHEIIAAGLVPIIEPEIDIHSPQKSGAEALLKAALLTRLDQLDPDRPVMLKLTLPEADDFYADFVAHANVLRVLALSGGYSRAEANARLARNHGVVASFSRALTEGLTIQQNELEFDAMLDHSIASIFEASVTPRAGTVRGRSSVRG
jgi:fructose-bisphosphate aldolase, class I